MRSLEGFPLEVLGTVLPTAGSSYRGELPKRAKSVPGMCKTFYMHAEGEVAAGEMPTKAAVGKVHWSGLGADLAISNGQTQSDNPAPSRHPGQRTRQYRARPWTCLFGSGRRDAAVLAHTRRSTLYGTANGQAASRLVDGSHTTKNIIGTAPTEREPALYG